jgi:DNA-binding HxlR family transcriptional regulator
MSTADERREVMEVMDAESGACHENVVDKGPGACPPPAQAGQAAQAGQIGLAGQTWPDGASQPGGETFCGVAAAATVLGDTWTLLIVRDLSAGARRFGELQTSTGISARVLTDRLRAMAEAGLITRKMYAEIPPRVEYTLTAKGADAVAVVDSLRVYGEKWLRPA